MEQSLERNLNLQTERSFDRSCDRSFGIAPSMGPSLLDFPLTTNTITNAGLGNQLHGEFYGEFHREIHGESRGEHGRNLSSNRIPNSTCFVFYLPPSATNETLLQLFVRYGTVINAYVAMDKVTNRTRGFGFVDFSTPSEAQAAVTGLDKYPLEGKFLSVSIKV